MDFQRRRGGYLGGVGEALVHTLITQPKTASQGKRAAKNFSRSNRPEGHNLESLAFGSCIRDRHLHGVDSQLIRIACLRRPGNPGHLGIH